MAKHKRGGLEPISRLIARVYPSREPADLAATRAIAWWSKGVSPMIFKNARPVKLSRGVLLVHTSSAAWADSLQYESEQILSSIRKHAPEAVIRKILFRVGPLPKIAPAPRQKKSPPPPLPLTELPETVARQLAAIADDQVREAVARAAAVALATRKSPTRDK